MFIIKYLYCVSNNPLSRFPQGGKALFSTPWGGEGWEGGPNDLIKYYLFLIPDSHK
jgi:hypothetical protein